MDRWNGCLDNGHTRLLLLSFLGIRTCRRCSGGNAVGARLQNEISDGLSTIESLRIFSEHPDARSTAWLQDVPTSPPLGVPTCVCVWQIRQLRQIVVTYLNLHQVRRNDDIDRNDHSGGRQDLSVRLVE